MSTVIWKSVARHVLQAVVHQNMHVGDTERQSDNAKQFP